MIMQTIRVRSLAHCDSLAKSHISIGPSITLVPIDKSSIIGSRAEADEER